jgi:hypothetical protein
MDGTRPTASTPATMIPQPDQLDRVYRCAWCRWDTPTAGHLPYYTYRADGSRVAADPAGWSGSDGICPGHGARLRAGLRRPVLAA